MLFEEEAMGEPWLSCLGGSGGAGAGAVAGADMVRRADSEEEMQYR